LNVGIIAYLILLCAQRFALPAAGEKKVWKRETAKAQNNLQKRAQSQPSDARFVRRFVFAIRTFPDFNDLPLISNTTVFFISMEPVTTNN